MTFKDLMEELMPALKPMTSNKLRDVLGMTHTEQCRRWLRGTFKPCIPYIHKLSEACGMDFDQLKERIDECR